MTAPIPPEFQREPDSYEPIPAMWVDADYYVDGELVHAARRPTPEQAPEQAPGWTAQGARRGRAA